MLVIGDNHVVWLKQFVVCSDVRFCAGTSVFEARDCRVIFAGYRGGTTRSVSRHRQIAEILYRELPRIVVGALVPPTLIRLVALRRSGPECSCMTVTQILLRQGEETVVVWQEV